MKKEAKKNGDKATVKKKATKKIRPMKFEEINLDDFPPGQEDVPFEFSNAKPGSDKAIQEAMEYAKKAGLDKDPRSR